VDYKMHNSLQKLVLLLLTSSFLLSACSALDNATPGLLIPGLAQTLAAETMTAQQPSQLDTESRTAAKQPGRTTRL
jgi:hypothetical protein